MPNPMPVWTRWAGDATRSARGVLGARETILMTSLRCTTVAIAVAAMAAALSSAVATAGETSAAVPLTVVTGGILLSPAEIAALPTSGAAWTALLNRSNTPSGDPAQLASRGDHNKDVLSNALVAARLNDNGRRGYVRDEIRKVITARRDVNDVLGTLRHLQTYVISADLINLAQFDTAFDATFRSWLTTEIRFNYSGGGGGGSVISIHNKKANNFGTHAGATRVAADLYLGDAADLLAASNIWKGWATGDPALQHSTRTWAGTNWQAQPSRPAGINVKGATRDGHSLDGVIPEDQERCGEYRWPPCSTGYIHGATDGMTLAFWMLARQGYTPWEWGDRAALRQYQWKLSVGQPAIDGFRWQIPVLNRVYGTAYGDADPKASSTNFGYAAWWAQH